MSIERADREVRGLPLPVRPKAGIPSVDWWITSRCNLACDFCYGPVPAKDPIRLQEEILQALLASSARAVTFCGGEPLMVRRIDQYAAALRQRGKLTVLNTNGLLLCKRHGQGFGLAGFTTVGFSVDGPTPEIHRAMRGEKADLDETLKAARLVREEGGTSLKLATVVSGVNWGALPALAKIVSDLKPDVWRLYQYSRRGDQNVGQRRHRLGEDAFLFLAKGAANLAEPVRTAPSTEAETAGCLIIDSAGNVLTPFGLGYHRFGNCIQEPLDRIWMRIPAQSTIISNKRWLSDLAG